MMRWILLLSAMGAFLGIMIPLWNEAKAKKNILLGVTLPFEGRADAGILRLCRRYRKNLAVVCGVVAAGIVPMLLLRSDGQIFFYFSLWLLAAMALPYLVYLSAHRQLAVYKQEQGWRGTAAGQMVVDLKAAGVTQQPLSALHFIVPTLLCLLPNVASLAQGITDFYRHSVGLFTAPIIPLIYFFYRFINRQRADVVDENTGLSAALTQVRRHNWNQMYAYTSWLTALMVASMALLTNHSTLMLVVTLVYLVVTVAVAIRIELRVRSAQRKLTEEAGQDFYVDDDQFWPLGIFYHNPHDRHVMINQRTGMNMTMNLGRPAGKFFMGLSALAILGIPFFALWFMGMESAPLTITVSETQVVSYYEVDFEDIVSVSLMEELPNGVVRTMGTGMEHFLQGNFAMNGAPKCKFNLDPTMPPFLRIDTEAMVYVLGTREPEETRLVYELLARQFG
jgi:Predicted membrane protein